MTYSLRKIQMTLAALALIAAAPLQGNYESECCRVENCCEPEYCCVKRCGRFFLDIDLLYLRAFEGGLSSVCDSTQITDTTVGGVLFSTLVGDAHDPDFNWNFGFRIGAGYEFAECNCGFAAHWTHYDSHTHGDRNSNNAHNWQIDFEVLDLLCGCGWNLGPCFAMSPFAGVRFANIDQKLNTHLVSTFTTTAGSTFTTTTGVSKEDFFGIGPLVGLEGNWGLRCGFGLYGEVAIGLLYGRYHVRTDQTEVSDSGVNFNHLRKHIQATQAVLDAGFGINWQTCFCRNKLLILYLGLEQHRYFNHNQFCSYGDLNLDGISLGLTFVY